MAEDRMDPNTGQPPERYPSVRQDDAVERTGRTDEVAGEVAGEEASFDRAADAPTPASNEGRLGTAGDPAEGKR